MKNQQQRSNERAEQLVVAMPIERFNAFESESQLLPIFASTFHFNSEEASNSVRRHERAKHRANRFENDGIDFIL